MSESSKIFLYILNEATSDIQRIEAYDFYANEDRILRVQLWHEGNEQAYVLDTGSTADVILPMKSGFKLRKTMQIDATNRSILSVTLTSDDTNNLASGDVEVEFIENGATRRAKQLKGEKGLNLL